MSTTLHDTITVCCNRPAHSQHCLPAGVETRELNLKYARATGVLNPGPFALAAECVTARPTRPLTSKRAAVLGQSLNSVRYEIVHVFYE